ncbi:MULTISPECIES: DinB family protein [unclassified Paenibacillus]|uniref:DinB family protein n=1 Tax=unclassified Paenibacillus TaxID=185978 RepID=UPI002404ACBC|nr:MULTISPECIES: DinB family protein [unclassified Paenibacillus]MDF9839774.1 putative damage-inducible protein DinB [Paenibacillus sp. PastF-2]MDF9846354.1 putative damage-inducible protein DinB [Paenibacillus sp. PastM-2]MDF9853296.1 putative damage-inducible protein DinB [Paenibacillus sp. PastF-1]MDH6478200.1 putative damage-inducible protein DinB [Paenibacillus sp. PastH-2]MDH6506301.1 putative damage-inducible protein DinB [Paenibacillus sp. PastM-3]
MRETFVFETLGKHRNRLLKLVEECSNNKRSLVPEHFNNNLHWQIGHVLIMTEQLIFGLTNQQLALPVHYNKFFGSGTRPADWKEAAPDWDLLVIQLKEQPDRIQERFQNKHEMPVKENFLKAECTEEVIISSVLHEVNHIGNISAMLKLLHV